MITHKMKSMLWHGGPCLLFAAVFLSATGAAGAEWPPLPPHPTDVPPAFLKACEMKRLGQPCKMLHGKSKVEKAGSCMPTSERSRRLFCSPGARMWAPPPGLLGRCANKKENDACVAQFARRKVQGQCKLKPGAGMLCLPGHHGDGPSRSGGELKDAKKGLPLAHPLNPGALKSGVK